MRGAEPAKGASPPRGANPPHPGPLPPEYRGERGKESPVCFLKHDFNADRVRLRELTLYCDRYTPVVALEEANAPECLLLDVTGSSHLFGGEQRLAEKAVADLRRLGYLVCIGLADGIGAAWAVAHSLGGVVSPGKNRDIVPELGVDVLRLPPETVRLLHQFDVRHVRQLMELPRGQVAVRFGQETLTRLDQALGVASEVLAAERRTPPVQAVWTFEDPVSHSGVIEKVLEQLIRQIVEALTPRQHGVQRLFCSLTTVDKVRTDFTLGLLHPTLSAERLLGLTRLRLERMTLPAAVAAIETSAHAAPLDVRQPRWFESEGEGRRAAAFRDFVERVSSRLGDEAVLQPRLCPEEQPEYAYEYVPWLRRREHREAAVDTEIVPGRLASPIDLLPSPLAVHVETADERPRQFAWRQRRYDIARVWGPQRIETGWWRGRDIHRDYYRVEAAGGERFWIFRDRQRDAWFLHGVFA